MKSYQDLTHHALDIAAKTPLAFDFKRFFTEQLMEGLVSKGYIELVNRNGSDVVVIKLTGMRALLDYEGLPYD